MKIRPSPSLGESIKESLYRSTRWVVFEPNEERLWGRIRQDVTGFMESLFRRGAFAGATPRDAYFVKCDKETTTQDDVNTGIVNVVVGFAPLKPAEFVIIRVQQRTGDGRFDPYKNFQFRVSWNGRDVAGFSKLTGVGHRNKYAAITLERGVTHDIDFARWANSISAKSLRKDIIIEVCNEAEVLAVAYKVFRCWVSEFEPLPDLDANANAVAIRHMKLENEGWERDKPVDSRDSVR